MGWEIDHKNFWYLKELICVDWHKQSLFPLESLRHILPDCCEPLQAAPARQGLSLWSNLLQPHPYHSEVISSSQSSPAVPLQRHRKPHRDTVMSSCMAHWLYCKWQDKGALHCPGNNFRMQVPERYSQVSNPREGTAVFEAVVTVFWNTPCQRLI